MKSKIMVSVIILSLLPLLNVLAEENNLEGSITATGVLRRLNGNEAKFNEYRDIHDGVYGRIRLNYDTDQFFGKFKADDIAYDTQYYRLDGGMWGKFKADIYYNEIPHNFTFNARSFYGGIGSDNLTFSGAAPSTNVSTWNEFDYSIKRKNLGGGFQLDLLKPFFFDISASREKKEGKYPIGVSLLSPGGPALEQVPMPIDYTTTNIKLEGGYVKNPLFLSLSYFYSQFENDKNNLFFRNPSATVADPDIFTLPPDNHYFKLAFKGAVKLPMNSKFNTNLAFSKAESDADSVSYYINNTGGRSSLILSDPKFSGRIDTQNYDFALSSNPISFLDGKVFYKHYKISNKSDEIITTDPGPPVATQVNELFDYKKDRVGAELGFMLPVKFYLTTAYNYVKTKREGREDIPENKDNIYKVDLRWNGLDFMVPRVGYERLNRKANFEGSTDPNDIEFWVRRFDAAAQNRVTYNASLDIAPLENMNFGIGYKHTKADYKNTTLGITGRKGDEADINGDYTIGRFIKLFGNFAYERIEIDQLQRQFTTVADPRTAPTAANFNWSATQKDTEYDYSIGAEVYVIPQKLTLVLQNDYVKSDGLLDYTVFRALNAGETQDNIDIHNWDDYRLESYLVKAIYNATKTLTFTVGYAYQKFKYNDAQFEGYQYTVGAFPTGSSAALTGAYSDPSYNAHLFFGGVTYKF
jgi:MtrB/PioB family decaheme-associated outer membrane protein